MLIPEVAGRILSMILGVSLDNLLPHPLSVGGTCKYDEKGFWIFNSYGKKDFAYIN